MTFCSNGLTPDKLGELSAKTAGEDDEDNPAAAESGLLWTYQRTAEVSRYVTKKEDLLGPDPERTCLISECWPSRVLLDASVLPAIVSGTCNPQHTCKILRHYITPIIRQSHLSFYIGAFSDTSSTREDWPYLIG